MELPSPGMTIERGRTALVVTDLQNDFFSPGGVAWEQLKDGYAKLGTIDNVEALLRAARDGGYPVFVSPHYYYPSDRRWVDAGGAFQVAMRQLGIVARGGPLTLEGFEGSGADWPERFKPYLDAAHACRVLPRRSATIIRKRQRRLSISASPAASAVR